MAISFFSKKTCHLKKAQRNINCNLDVFLGFNCESSARATGHRPYSSSQVRCYAKLKSYQPTSQHLTCLLEVSGLQQVGNLRLCHVEFYLKR